MKKFIPFLFVIFLFASSSSYAFDFIKLGTGHDDDFWGTQGAELGPDFPSTLQYLAERGKIQTNPINTLDVTDANVQGALAGDFGSFDALLFSEDIEVLTPETYGLINNYASGGGCVIVSSVKDSGDDLLSGAFGYNVTSDGADDDDTYALQGGARGTAFGGGPTTLLAPSATNFFSNTPGIDIYSGDTGVTVFTDKFGAGIVTIVGWDYCCTGGPTTEEEGPILDWYEVMNRAFDQCFPPPAGIPTLSEWGLIAMAGILGIVGFMVLRRRKVTA